MKTLVLRRKVPKKVQKPRFCDFSPNKLIIGLDATLYCYHWKQQNLKLFSPTCKLVNYCLSLNIIILMFSSSGECNWAHREQLITKKRKALPPEMAL